MRGKRDIFFAFFNNNAITHKYQGLMSIIVILAVALTVFTVSYFHDFTEQSLDSGIVHTAFMIRLISKEKA